MTGDLDQAATAIALAITVRFRGITQLHGQIAGVVFAQVLIAAQLTHVLQLTGFVPDLREERRLTLRRVDLPMVHGGIQHGYKKARLAADVGHNVRKLAFR
ncbi:hypothetical protein D3C78_1743070 [compost metagenome]